MNFSETSGWVTPFVRFHSSYLLITVKLNFNIRHIWCFALLVHKDVVTLEKYKRVMDSITREGENLQAIWSPESSNL
ncbi:hypothetical protein L2E82_38130 [Cichorium intybus]|uniref:Uncharacterized protein n=1 Tax=Cichorium intybus TaxID=13427 RepID=A0ACB9AFH9_CICIN|nr:hypothetical protein L2E82_38130 [Cichorium intybus]